MAEEWWYEEGSYSVPTMMPKVSKRTKPKAGKRQAKPKQFSNSSCLNYDVGESDQFFLSVGGNNAFRLLV